MKFNIWFTLTVLSVGFFNSDAKKCCNKGSSAAISKGRAIATFQDHYPGILIYISGDVVTVFSKDVIEGIEFWEAEIGGQSGYIEAAAVKEYSAICTPIEVNDGVHVFSKTKDSRSNVDELKISSKTKFDLEPNRQTLWYGMWLSIFEHESVEFWKELTYLIVDLDSFLKSLEWYIYSDRRCVTIIMLLVGITIITNVWLRREIKLKDDQILKLVEKATDLDVENFDLRTKMNDIESAAEDREDMLNCLLMEKDDFEQKEVSFKDNERILELNVEYLRERFQQMEAQELAMQEENSSLTLANKCCVSTIAKLMFDKENLEVIKDLMEDDRQRLEIELDQKDKQLAEHISKYEAMKIIIDHLEAEAESRKCDKLGEKVTVELSKTSEKQLIETQRQCDYLKSRLNTATLQLETAYTGSKILKEHLQGVHKELEVCRSYLEKERAKSEVVIDFYKDTLHTRTHSCNHLKSGDNVNLSLFKQCQELKDQVQHLEAGMRNLELSYIGGLNHELKQNIKGSEALQKFEEKQYKNQKELTKCKKRIAQLEAQSCHNLSLGRRPRHI